MTLNLDSILVLYFKDIPDIKNEKTLEALIEEIPRTFNLGENELESYLNELNYFYCKYPPPSGSGNHNLFSWYKYRFMLEFQKYMIVKKRKICPVCTDDLDPYADYYDNHFNYYDHHRLRTMVFVAQLKFKWLKLLKMIKKHIQYLVEPIHFLLTDNSGFIPVGKAKFLGIGNRKDSNIYPGITKDVVMIIETYIIGFDYRLITPQAMLFYTLIQDHLWLNISTDDEHEIDKLYPINDYSKYITSEKIKELQKNYDEEWYDEEWYGEHYEIYGVHDEDNVRDLKMKERRGTRRHNGLYRRIRGK